jgi:hypothetical protein
LSKNEFFKFSDCEPKEGRRIWCHVIDKLAKFDDGTCMERMVFLNWNPEFKNRFDVEFIEWQYADIF